MIEIQANIFDIYKNYNAICCTTNSVVTKSGELVMGAGIAKEFKTKYPWLPRRWGQIIKDRQYTYVYILVTLMKKEPHLIYFQTKIDWKLPAEYNLIEESALHLSMLTDMMNWKKILLPRPGCTNGGADWDDIARRIRFLDDRFTVCSK